jgi:hypothetical protein
MHFPRLLLSHMKHCSLIAIVLALMIFSQNQIKAEDDRYEVKEVYQSDLSYLNQESKPYRIRYANSEELKNRTSPRMDGEKYDKYTSFAVIFGSWGVEYSKQEFWGNWYLRDGSASHTGQFHKDPSERGEIEVYYISYTFGQNFTFTITQPFYAKGDVVIGVPNNDHDYFVLEDEGSKTITPDEMTLMPMLDFGITIWNLEIFYKWNIPRPEFSGFKCVGNGTKGSCIDPDSQDGLSWGSESPEQIIGVGIVF